MRLRWPDKEECLERAVFEDSWLVTVTTYCYDHYKPTRLGRLWVHPARASDRVWKLWLARPRLER